MKTKKMLLITPILFFVMGMMSGCKQCGQHEIYENHDISACGVEDPLVNIEWLTKFCHERQKAYFVEIILYKNKTSDDNHIVINTKTKFIEGQSPSPIYTTSVYECNGNLLLFQGTEGLTPDGWDEFFENNEHVSLIWSVKFKE